MHRTSRASIRFDSITRLPSPLFHSILLSFYCALDSTRFYSTRLDSPRLDLAAPLHWHWHWHWYHCALHCENDRLHRPDRKEIEKHKKEKRRNETKQNKEECTPPSPCCNVKHRLGITGIALAAPTHFAQSKMCQVRMLVDRSSICFVSVPFVCALLLLCVVWCVLTRTWWVVADTLRLRPARPATNTVGSGGDRQSRVESSRVPQ